MGLYASANLCYGIVLPAWDDSVGEYGDYAPWYIGDEEDDRDFDLGAYIALKEGIVGADYDTRKALEEKSSLTYHTFGHYDAEEPTVILSPKGMPTFDGDCFDPGKVDLSELTLYKPHESKVITRAVDEARELGFPDLNDADWLLVASYG